MNLAVTLHGTITLQIGQSTRVLMLPPYRSPTIRFQRKFGFVIDYYSGTETVFTQDSLVLQTSCRGLMETTLYNFETNTYYIKITVGPKI